MQQEDVAFSRHFDVSRGLRSRGTAR